MTENKHTPGPWKLERPVHPDDLRAQIIAWDRPPYKTHIVTVYADSRGEFSPAANAALIAAAPALLEACKQIVWKLNHNYALPDYEGPARITRNDATVRMAIAAIEEATHATA